MGEEGLEEREGERGDLNLVDRRLAGECGGGVGGRE